MEHPVKCTASKNTVGISVKELIVIRFACVFFPTNNFEKTVEFSFSKTSH